jgi:hypothetical protein
MSKSLKYFLLFISGIGVAAALFKLIPKLRFWWEDLDGDWCEICEGECTGDHKMSRDDQDEPDFSFQDFKRSVRRGLNNLPSALESFAEKVEDWKDDLEGEVSKQKRKSATTLAKVSKKVSKSSNKASRQVAKVSKDLSRTVTKARKQISKKFVPNAKTKKAIATAVGQAGKLNERQREISKLLRRNDVITLPDLLSLNMGVSDRTLRRDMDQFEKMGLVKQVGKTKNSYYEVLKAL